MNDDKTLPAWTTLAETDDEQVPLLDCALLIARDEYPDLDVAACLAQVEAHAASLRPVVDALGDAPLKMQAINRRLFEELGYAGDHDEYYDPRNSYLNMVLHRRLGNPISLAVIQMDVARRLGVPLDGISFPGHFLVRLPVGDGMLVMDPFNRGRPLGTEELRRRAKPHFGDEVPDDALFDILSPAPNRAILSRILRNLHALYAGSGDWARAVRCMDRVLSLLPDNAEALRDRGTGYAEMGHVAGAAHDLGGYLRRWPDADDADEVRGRLLTLLGDGRKSNRPH